MRTIKNFGSERDMNRDAFLSPANAINSCARIKRYKIPTKNHHSNLTDSLKTVQAETKTRGTKPQTKSYAYKKSLPRSRFLNKPIVIYIWPFSKCARNLQRQSHTE